MKIFANCYFARASTTLNNREVLDEKLDLQADNAYGPKVLCFCANVDKAVTSCFYFGIVCFQSALIGF